VQLLGVTQRTPSIASRSWNGEGRAYVRSSDRALAAARKCQPEEELTVDRDGLEARREERDRLRLDARARAGDFPLAVETLAALSGDAIEP
jgi:hypothetical protein